MFPLSNEILSETLKEFGIKDITKATIRQICAIAGYLEKIAAQPYIHFEIGNPGLPAAEIGINAEIESLKTGIANQYPDIHGIPVLKENASKFIKAFLDINISPKSIIPTVGSMQGSFTLMLLLGQREPDKDTILFLNPGFPAQHTQAKVLGLKEQSFDIYNYRGKKLEQKLEQYMKSGRITALIFSNPNNPAWTNLTNEELEIIGRLATKYDVVVLEDLAYMGMDFRTDFSTPYEPPFIPSVGKYTDNYILLMSASKIFSYAGQRIAIAAFSDKLYERHFSKLQQMYNVPSLGDAYVFGILYAASSGTSHSAQYALAAMLEAAVEKKLDFISISREYERRAKIIRKLLTQNGFHIVYDMDGENPVKGGFFFTAGYGNLTSAELQSELIRYGISSISLPSTGSEQNGIRVCVSMISDDDTFKLLEERLKMFNADHQIIKN